MNQYQFGSQVGLTAMFLSGNAPVDPTTVTLRVLDPAGTETILTLAGGGVTRLGVGSYAAQILADTVPGFWSYRWEGAGAAVAADETRFQVLQSNFADAQP